MNMITLRAFTLAAIISPLAIPVSAQSLHPTLKREIIVASDLVHIGDLVDNVGDAAHVAIFRAPDLGQSGTVQVQRILDALRPHHLTFVDTRSLAEVRVIRASRLITVKEVESAIAQTLAGKSGLGEARNLAITLDRDFRPTHFEATAQGELQVGRSLYDPKSRRFDISYDLPDSAIAQKLKLRFTGTISESVEAAVLTRPMARGERIRTGDVSVERRPKNEAQGEHNPDVSDIIGKAARRPLRAGQILSRNDLMKPELVARGEPVTILYEVPGIRLTLRGKAVEGGTDGDVINVINEQSKRTVQGTVVGPGRVMIGSPRPIEPPSERVAATDPSPIAK